MKKWLKRWRGTLLAGCAAFVLCFALTLAYLTDIETKKNVVVLGNVKVKLTEDPYEDEQTVVPGQVIEKPPVVSNTGKNDAYVFVELTIPKSKVQMLYETDEGDNKAGTLKDAAPTLQEIFRTIAEGEATGKAAGNADISYNKGTALAEGWEYLGLGEETNTKKAYWLGFNRKLAAADGDTKDTTNPVFDKVQLKSFIDEDIDDDDARTIGINVFAIQSDNLELFDEEPAFLTKTQLQEVLKVIRNKKSELGEIIYE